MTDIDFKTYYHKKLDEEMEAAQQSTAEQSYETQAMNSSLDSLVQRYVGNGDMKHGIRLQMQRKNMKPENGMKMT